MPRRPEAPRPRLLRETSSSTANLLLCDVISSLAEQAFLAPFGDRPVVVVFGVRMVLGPAEWAPWERATFSATCGTLEAGRLYRLVRDGPGRRVAGQQPQLWIRAGRLVDGRGTDLGSALEEVAFALPGASQAATRGKPVPARVRRSRSSESVIGRST